MTDYILTNEDKIEILQSKIVELIQRIERLEQLVHMNRPAAKGEFYEPDEW